ncbi:TetR/AcrR family transcriptional regulator [Paenibacillus whitsoniae]|uniref:TetR/AcrR family transcriptional regulator n=1 Tax=Paenibacillus whitsoniae TaxID=2496558 RepID=A0A3S0BZA5_9BACL|nr:TetR/AcrR family transcriptional regulator [Paenibacillus whitsoniae]RTE11646.1 TetR/AcrR family transcriptional regulator [Paenibacillus whitsoniae]
MARSKEFEENVVLERAMRLFWEQGYEKTSLNDLVEKMGIHRRSLYDTFTDKHTLFLKAMDRFGERMAARWEASIKQASTAEEAIRLVFNLVIEGEEDTPAGCMLVNSAVELANRDQSVDEKTSYGFAKSEQLLTDLVEQGQREGQFSKRFEAKELAEYLHNALSGVRVMARTSASKEKLHRIADLSLDILKR